MKKYVKHFILNVPSVIFTFLLSCRRYMWVLGLFLDVEVDIVLLHVEVDGGGGVTVHH